MKYLNLFLIIILSSGNLYSQEGPEGGLKYEKIILSKWSVVPMSTLWAYTTNYLDKN